MSTRDQNWIRLGGLATAAFALGLLFAGILDLPGRSQAQARPPRNAPVVPARAAAPDEHIRLLAELSEANASIAERSKPAVVYVQSTMNAGSPSRTVDPRRFRGQQPRAERGSGSGFIVSADGYILTNNHVVDGADRVTVRLLDRREFTARIVGADPTTDVAVLKIEATGLTPMPFGNSDQARVGEMVLAIGNPLGDNLTFTVTSGIISAKGRRLDGLARTERSISDFIQTDAAINPGNSGGPLVNIRGEVIGINSAIASETGTFQGYGFAIPINLARQVMDQLIADGRVTRAAIGVLVRDAGLSDAEFVGMTDVRGVVIQDWSGENSPARAAGLQRGDVIVTIDGNPVDYTGQLQQRVGFKAVGETVRVEVAREGGVRRTYNVRTVSAEDRSRAQIARADDPQQPEEEKDAAGNTVARGGAPLGITVTPLTDALTDRFQLRERVQGVVVLTVDPNGPAADVLLTEGRGGPDIIVAVNGRAVRSDADLKEALRQVGPGRIASLDLYNAQTDTRRVERVRLAQ